MIVAIPSLRCFGRKKQHDGRAGGSLMWIRDRFQEIHESRTGAASTAAVLSLAVVWNSLNETKQQSCIVCSSILDYDIYCRPS